MTTKKYGLLKDENPLIFSKIIVPVDSSVDISTLTSGSGQKVVWSCYCGLTFIRPIQAVTKYNRLHCRLCSATGKSRLEFEVSGLLSLFLNCEVINHYGPKRSEEVDIYVPSMDLAIQLDPFYTHHKKPEVDAKVFNRMQQQYTKALRVREEGLQVIQGCLYVPPKSLAIVWAETITAYLGVNHTANEIQIKQALIRANQKWDKIFSEPLKENLKTSIYGSEFIANITHPGRNPEFTPQKCADRILWQCSSCPNQWECPIATRKNGLGCPSCASKKGGQKKARAKDGRSIQELFPKIADSFVKNTTHPDRKLDSLKPTSGDVCIWKCSKGHLKQSSVERYVKSQFCKQCQLLQRIEKENIKKRAAVTSFLSRFPFISDEFSQTKNQKEISDIDFSDKTIYSWECSFCSLEFNSTLRGRRASIAQRLSSGLEVSCIHPKQKIEKPPEAHTAKAMADNPHLKLELVRNLTHPNSVPKLNDICLWKCSVCSHEWKSKLSNRRKGTGCKKCALKKSTAGRIAPKEGSNLKTLFPSVANEFIENLTRPNRGISDITVNSRDLCIWKCSVCGKKHTAIVYSKTQSFKLNKTTCFHAKKSLVSS